MRFTLGAAALLVTLTAPFARAAEPATQASRAPVTDAQLDEALDAAAREQQGPAFDQIMQSVASRFPLVTASTERGKAVWNKVTLNRRGKKLDAFRFRMPEGEPRDMLWSFICNDLRYEWYILPASGRMTGFRRNWYYKPQEILGDTAPAGSKDLVLQALAATSLKPGAEHIVWFKFRHAKPMPTYVAINLLPAAEDPETIEAPNYIANAVGLSRAGDPIAAIAVEAATTTQPTR